MPPKWVYAVTNAAVAPWQATTVIQRERHLPGVCLVSWLKRGLTIVELPEFPTPGRSDHSKGGNSVEERTWNCQEQICYLPERLSKRGAPFNIKAPLPVDESSGHERRKAKVCELNMRSDHSSGRPCFWPIQNLEHANVEC